MKRMLANSPKCEVGPKLKAVLPKYDFCTGTATCLHELKKRSAGGSITDINNVMRSCFTCNRFIEDQPSVAYQAGLVIKSWEDPIVEGTPS